MLFLQAWTVDGHGDVMDDAADRITLHIVDIAGEDRPVIESILNLN